MHRLGIGAKKTAMIRRTSNIVFANAVVVFPASEDNRFITEIELSVEGGLAPVLGMTHGFSMTSLSRTPVTMSP